MKLSLEWLKEYVELPQDITPEQISYDLTMCTVEVEEVIDLGSLFNDMYVGIVKELKPHPDADRLQIAMTDLGAEHGIKEIVCGGSNLSEGMAVVVAIPGAWVNWHGDTERTQLKLAKIRGVESFGMICASEEVGLSLLFPAVDQKEIIDLKDPEALAGKPLAEYLGFNDTILDIDNKSLTNRPDLWGHYGIARELSAIYKCNLKPLPSYDFSSISNSGTFDVTIHDTDLCQRFTATVVEGVSNGEAPLWMRAKLAKVGQRPISFLVDLTNYVMFAIGKPTHAFDGLQIANSKLHVRRASKSELLQLLDETELELSEDVLVVADDQNCLGLAGIMGGLGSGVTEQTTSVVLESANFHAPYIRRIAKRYDLRTESSMRFEKALDTESTLNSQAYLISLLLELQPAVKIVQFQDQFPVKPEPVTVKVSEAFIESRLGMCLSATDIKSSLGSLGYTVDHVGDEFSIEVPAWRSTGDVSLPEDIVEELARLIGYDNLDFEPIPIKLAAAVKQPWYETDQAIRNYLVRNAGLQEVVSYPWVSQKFIYACQAENQPAVELSSPPAPEQKNLKTCLVPSILELVEKNVRFFDSFGLFEISRVFLEQDKYEKSGVDESLPSQPKLLCVAWVAKDPQVVFSQTKGALNGLFKTLGFDVNFELCAGNQPAWADPKVCLDVKLGGQLIGSLALISKRTLRRSGIERVQVVSAVINLSEVYKLEATPLRYKPIPKFPEIEYDLAVVFEKKTAWQDISQTVISSDNLIKEVIFVDEYTGKQIDEDKKSVAFKMVLADENATLTSEQAETVATSVLENLKAKHSGHLRE